MLCMRNISMQTVLPWHLHTSMTAGACWSDCHASDQQVMNCTVLFCYNGIMIHLVFIGHMPYSLLHAKPIQPYVSYTGNGIPWHIILPQVGYRGGAPPPFWPNPLPSL